VNWTNLLGVLLGGSAAVACETIFRLHGGTYGQVATLTLVLAGITNYGVFHSMKLGNSLIEGMVIWTTATVGLRLLSTFFILHETPHLGNWIGFTLVVAASLISKFWR